MEKLLAKLNRLNIGLEVQDGNLDIYDPEDNLTDQLIGALKENKAEILKLLGGVQVDYEFNAIPQAAEKKYYNLSSAQKRMYFLYEFDKDSTAYNIPEVIRLELLDKEKLIRSFEKLIDRHEILRTTFHVEEEEPVQKIAPRVSFDIETFKTTTAELIKVVQDFERPFDLKNGPLLRVGIAQTSGSEQYLLLDMHHIISDGVSAGIMNRDFIALYTGQPLPPLKLQYKDYAEWQQSAKHQEEIVTQKSFWLKQFEEPSPVLELPTDFTRPLVKGAEGSSFHFDISKKQTADLKKIAKQEKTTLYTIVLSLYNILLSKLGNQEDIVIGTPVAGRQHADLENIIGLFVNTLPLRNQVQGDVSFNDFLSKVKSHVLECFENQSFQYEELIELLDIKRSTNRNPLFDCLFAMDNFGGNAQEKSTEERTFFENHPDEGMAKFDLSLTAIELKDQLTFQFEYSTELFEKQTIERFVSYFKTIVSTVLSNLDILISDIQLMPKEEMNRILFDFNDTAYDYPRDKTVVNLFEEQAVRNPHQIALYHNDKTLTYQQVDEKANQLAHYLLAQDSGEKPIIGLLMEKSMELFIGMIGIIKTGGAYLPLDGSQPDKRNLGILENANAKLLLTQKDKCKVYENHINTIDVLTKEVGDFSKEKPNISSHGEDIAYIIYTSGSTGKPKGVKIKHEGVTNLICSQSRAFQITDQDRVFQFSSLVFDASVEQIWVGLANGAGLVFADREVILNDAKLRELFHKYKVTHLDVTPTYLESIDLEEQKYLKRIILGGEACKPDTVKKYASQFRIFNSYGPTEATVTATMCELTPQLVETNKFPIGKPLDNCQVYILDKYQSLAPIGVAGELYIGGIGLAEGYLNAPELTAEKFIPHPFKEGEKLYSTGDLTRWLDDGNIEFLGRIDSQVKIRGFRIELGEIESALNLFDGIKECAVVAKDRNGENYLCAYYVGESDLKTKVLRQFLFELLPDYMVPAYFVELDRIPLNSSGKLNARLLPTPEFKEEEDFVSPSNDTEKKLLSIWSEILKIDESFISVAKSFFELGGHSLKAIQLLRRIQKVLKSEVALQDIFQHQTIRELSRKIDAGKNDQLRTNDTLTLLKQNEQSTGNLFFIHDGSGDVQGYMELVNLVKDFKCWGLRTNNVNQFGPQHTSVERMASSYIRELKKAQNFGPYKIIGWSVGGNIACEVVRQLEAMGEFVDRLIIIDSQIPFKGIDDRGSAENDFSTAKERKFITDIFKLDATYLEKEKTIPALWEKALDYCEKNNLDIAIFRNKIPEDIRYLIPHLDSLDLRALAAQVNSIRTLDKAVENYMPDAKTKLNTKLSYFKASDSDLNLEALSACFKEEISICEIEGDHFSILQRPQVLQLESKMNLHLHNKNEESTLI